MNTCKHCLDTIYTDYDTCMTCFEKQNPPKNIMEKTIEEYQKEINALQATVNGDGYNIKRLSEENEKLQNELECYKKNGDIQSDVLKRQWDILDKTLLELPVGYIPNHTYESIPDRVKYYVRENSILESNQNDANDLIEKSIPNFFDHPDAGNILDNTVILIKMANDDKLEAWADREALESLEKAIKTHYDYYKGFAAKKHLSSVQMLDALLMLCVADASDHESLVDDNRKLHGELAKLVKRINDADAKENELDHYKAALEEIVKRPRKSETCKLIAQKALGRLNDDEYQPELLIEENLKLKMKIEDLQIVINEKILDKVFHKKANPLTCCPDCGEYWDYHHEEHCEAKI